MNGNLLKADGESTVYGNYRYSWQLYLSSTFYLNGSTLASNTNDTASPGITVDRWYEQTLQATGPGTYSLANYHNAWNVSCSYWDTQTYTADQIVIQRPTRPDYYPGANPYLFYLGGVSVDGQYASQTVLTPGNANGAPESPTWVISSGSDKLSLSCTNCQNPNATAINNSSGCQTYDVVLQTSYNGFLSDPFYIFVNTPWNLVAGTDPVGGGWVYSVAAGNGYETHINYNTSGLCATDPPLSNYDVNEAFGAFVPDYSGENWPNGTAGHLYVPGTDWADKLSISEGAYGDSEYCGGVLCTPPFTNPGAGPHTLVFHASQGWFVGSSSNGVGAKVQNDTAQMYTDSGWHTDIVTPVR